MLRPFQPAAPEREARAGQRVDPAGRGAQTQPVCELWLRLDSRNISLITFSFILYLDCFILPFFFFFFKAATVLGASTVFYLQLRRRSFPWERGPNVLGKHL